MMRASLRFVQGLQERQSVRVAAGEIGYRESGNGIPAVFLPGLVANGLAWRNVVPALAGQARCIALDLPLGSHQPAVPDADLSLPGLARIVVDVLDALGLESAVLVGNGYGADIAQVVATTRADRVSGLVLVAPNAFGSEHWTVKALRWLAKPPGAGAVQARAMRIRQLWRTPVTYGWVTKRPIPDPIMESYLGGIWHDRAVRRDLQRFLRQLSPDDLAEASEKLAAFDRPAFVVRAAEDKVFPGDGAARLARTLPQGRLVDVADSYAWIPEDQPAELARLLGAFLGDVTNNGR